MTAASLNRTIGLYGAVTLAVGIVVGAGMLALPGLVYRAAEGWAVASWLLDGLLVLPLLVVFADLARRFPSAGGVAGFVGAAFPRLRVGCSYLLIGTFSLGLPAIALTGGNYLAGGLGVPAESLPLAGVGFGAVILFAALALTWSGARAAGSVQNVVVTLLVAGLAVVALLAAVYWERIDFAAGDPTLFGVWSGMALAFFAFTGWEMLAFTAEEFKNPRRDFPLAVGISFVVVLALYVGAALAVQALVDLDHPLLASAPLLVVLERGLGAAATPLLVAAVVLAIILVNLNGACWAASRLVFDIGRQGWAPRRLGLERLSGTGATPRAAVLGLAVLLFAVLALAGFGRLGLDDLLCLAGQNFFLLYTLAVVAYLRLSESLAARVFGASALLVCLLFMQIFGWGLLYAAALFALPYLVCAITARPLERPSSS